MKKYYLFGLVFLVLVLMASSTIATPIETVILPPPSCEPLPILLVDAGQDCNQNGIPDECEVQDSTVPDCNQNWIPDECESDSDFDGIPDGCDVYFNNPDNSVDIAMPEETKFDAEVPPETGIEEDPCGGKRCALYCKYGSVPGSCGCQCLPEPTKPTIESIQTEIVSMNLQGIGPALISILDNAQKSLDKGNQNAAINQLQAFINKVEAQRGKKISEKDADRLIANANYVIDSFFDVFVEVELPEEQNIKSEVAYLKLKDKKGTIEVQGFEHTITVPTHRQTGAATGETMHGVLSSKSKSWDLDGKGTDNVVEKMELAIEKIERARSMSNSDHDTAMAAIRNIKMAIAGGEPGDNVGLLIRGVSKDELGKAAESNSFFEIYFVDDTQFKDWIETIADGDPKKGLDAFIHTTAKSQKVVRFKAGSDLAHHVKSAMADQEPISIDEVGIHGILVIDEEGNTKVFYFTAVPAKQGKRAVLDIIEAEETEWKSWDLDGKGTDNVVEEIELAVEELKQLQSGYRKIIWEHKEQNTESEADWLDK